MSLHHKYMEYSVRTSVCGKVMFQINAGTLVEHLSNTVRPVRQAFTICIVNDFIVHIQCCYVKDMWNTVFIQVFVAKQCFRLRLGHLSNTCRTLFGLFDKHSPFAFLLISIHIVFVATSQIHWTHCLYNCSCEGNTPDWCWYTCGTLVTQGSTCSTCVPPFFCKSFQCT
jgi:hypothetical protein